MTSPQGTETIHIAMWSGPRNLSTAMMRSFSGRSDTFVSDEPFYGAYLRETGDPQPMADTIIEHMDCDWGSVSEALKGPAPDGSPIWYQKHMPHHMEGPVDITDFPEMRHAFLIRDPIRVAASYANKRTAINADHLGIVRQHEYFRKISDLTGKAPPVIDSADVLHDPEDILKKLCEALEVPWDSGMLSWETGPHPQDGIWGSHWYDKVNASTGFGFPPGALPVLEPEFQAVADTCRDDYEALRAHALQA